MTMACDRSAQREPLSESVQMYLVGIARLRMDADPVPLARLARELAISVVSVNEMCRKLQDQGLVIYQPYKGASLTAQGERLANYVLRRHRLWEVLLVDRLGLSFDEAHEMACQLEHATPDVLADRLDDYLGHPQANPLGEAIPRTDGTAPPRVGVSLPAVGVSQTAQVLRVTGDAATRAYLTAQGVRPGAAVALAAVTDEAVLLDVAGTHLALERRIADGIVVEQTVAAGAERRHDA